MLFLATNAQKPTFPCIPDKQNVRKKRQDFSSNLGLNPDSELFGQSRVNKESNLSNHGPTILNRSKNPASTGRDGSFRNTSNTVTDESPGIGILSELLFLILINLAQKSALRFVFELFLQTFPR